jgi:hypothetical protein
MAVAYPDGHLYSSLKRKICDDLDERSEKIKMEPTTTITTIIRKENERRISRHVQFALCGSCFWCASYLDGKDVEEECLSCKSKNTVELMPVAGNEMYTFDYDVGRGVTVHFVPLKSLA